MSLLRLSLDFSLARLAVGFEDLFIPFLAFPGFRWCARSAFFPIASRGGVRVFVNLAWSLADSPWLPSSSALTSGVSNLEKARRMLVVETRALRPVKQPIVMSPHCASSSLLFSNPTSRKVGCHT